MTRLHMAEEAADPRGLLKWERRQHGFHGVMVSTLDSESSDPSSNLGGT